MGTRGGRPAPGRTAVKRKVTNMHSNQIVLREHLLSYARSDFVAVHGAGEGDLAPARRRAVVVEPFAEGQTEDWVDGAAGWRGPREGLPEPWPALVHRAEQRRKVLRRSGHQTH